MLPHINIITLIAARFISVLVWLHQGVKFLTIIARFWDSDRNDPGDSQETDLSCHSIVMSEP